VLFVNLRTYKVQPLWMEVPQVVAFSSIVYLLKVMHLSLHSYFELKSQDYRVIIIEFMNCFPTKFDGEILYELPLIHHISIGAIRIIARYEQKV